MNRSPITIGSLAAVSLLLLTMPSQSARAEVLRAIPIQFESTVKGQSLALSPLVAVDPTEAYAQTDRTLTNSNARTERGWLWLLLLLPVGGIAWWRYRSQQLEPLASEGVTHLAATSAPDPDRSRQPSESISATTAPPLVAPQPSPDRDSQRLPTGASEPVTTDRLLVEPGRAKSISLLEERLAVNLTKRKVGEIVVRKEVETRIVEIPVRHEKLIVEQVEPEYKQLAVIDLTTDAAEPFTLVQTSPTVEAKFTSTAAAIEFLESLGDRSSGEL